MSDESKYLIISKDVIETCKEEIISLNDEIKETRKVAPNSYGLGYDVGYRDALRTILDKIHDVIKGVENE